MLKSYVRQTYCYIYSSNIKKLQGPYTVANILMSVQTHNSPKFFDLGRLGDYLRGWGGRNIHEPFFFNIAHIILTLIKLVLGYPCTNISSSSPTRNLTNAGPTISIILHAYVYTRVTGRSYNARTCFTLLYHIVPIPRYNVNIIMPHIPRSVKPFRERVYPPWKNEMNKKKRSLFQKKLFFRHDGLYDGKLN